MDLAAAHPLNPSAWIFQIRPNRTAYDHIYLSILPAACLVGVIFRFVDFFLFCYYNLFIQSPEQAVGNLKFPF